MAEQENKQSIEERRFGESIFAGYKGGEEMPLARYAALLGIYNAAFLALLLAAQNSKEGLPERIGFTDLLLLGVISFRFPHFISMLCRRRERNRRVSGCAWF